MMGKEEQCRVYILLQVIEKLPRLLEATPCNEDFPSELFETLL